VTRRARALRALRPLRAASIALPLAAAVLAAAFVPGCAGTRPAPAASASAPREAGRVVAVSFDGLGGVRLNDLLAAGALDAGGFSAFAGRGILAGRAVDVTPSLTPVAHIAAITGAPPSRTGIVANQFRESGSPFGTFTTGFLAPIGTETLWEAARRQGRRVAVLLYPGADATSESRRGDLGLVWPEKPALESAFVRVAGDAWTDAAAPAGRSFSPARQTRVPVSTPAGTVTLRLTATDTTDDGAANYDLVAVARESASGLAALGAVPARGWFALSVPGRGGSITAWCRLEGLDPGLARAELYVGAFYAVPGYPDDYRRRLEQAIGGWPGPPDYAFMRGSRSDFTAHEEQAERLAEYLTKAIDYTVRHERFDLLVGYEPLVDEVEHAFEPGPGGGSRDAVVGAFRTADRSVATILAALSPRDSFLFFSDHGMVPLTSGVNLEKFLVEKGWTPVGPKGPGEGARRVQVCATSGIAHVYLDPALSGAARETTAGALLADLRGLADLKDGLVDDVVPHAGLARIGLDNPRSGDVVVLLTPGNEFRRGGPQVLGSPGNRGGHGYRAAYPVLDASFGAIGPGIVPARPETVSLLEVAARAARALGIEPPRGAAPAGR
jgi:predicted AlkP superfamily pyrophosphatase or phosphodiesterase